MPWPFWWPRRIRYGEAGNIGPLDETGIGDLSVTGWALMALHTARMASIEVLPEAFLLASAFLDSVQGATGRPGLLPISTGLGCDG